MQLLSAAPAVNLELWSQLSRAAGCQGYWQLAKECAVAALGALPADKRDLGAVKLAGDVPGVSGQGWYWLSVAEMQQGQVRMPGARPALKALFSFTQCWKVMHSLEGILHPISHPYLISTTVVNAFDLQCLFSMVP